MNIENIYVIISKGHGEGGNQTQHSLVSEKVYSSEEDAYKDIINEDEMKVISVYEWGGEMYDAGYIEAYG